MRLIDATYQDENLKWWLDTNTEKGVTCIPEFVVRKILNQSTVKAEPIRYAHWIEIENYPFAAVYACSECGREITTCGSKTPQDYPYCHCGCKMYEVNEDESR